MLTSGRRRGGKAGTGLSAWSVRLTLGRLTAALEMAVAERKIGWNPARYVKPPEHTPRQRATWTKTEVRTFLAVADADRLAACWRLGRPVHPEWYTDEFHRVSDRAKVRRIRLHESRHTTCSLMEGGHVPASIIAAWAGHYSAAFTMATYVHANPEDLAAGRDALAAIYGTEEAR